MSKYRKKPVVIDAMRWSGEVGAAGGYNDVLAWLIAEMVPYRVNDMGEVIIPTLEGDMTATRGDWIIRGVAGEFYPCKPDIFAATYEAADDCGRCAGVGTITVRRITARIPWTETLPCPKCAAPTEGGI